MYTIIQDLRYSIRTLAKKPGFTLIAVATLALGIGVNTALFTGFNIFLRPKPVKDPDTIVRLEYQGASRERRFSFSDYAYFRDHNQVFSDVIAAQEEEKFLLGEESHGFHTEEILGNFVSDNYFATLGGSAAVGRLFTPEENRSPGQDTVMVLSHRFWQRRFAGDTQIVGRSLLLNGKPFTVVGVTSPSYVGLKYATPDIWLPLMMRSAMPTVHFEDTPPDQRDWFGSRKFRWIDLSARLKPGKTIVEARAELALMLGQLASTNAEVDARDTVLVESINEVRGDSNVWSLMPLVLGASGLVLLIACFNIANMQLARASSRQKEIGVRLCLGASRWRLIRQLLTESFLLAALGGLLGMLLAWWSLDLLFAGALARYGAGDLTRLAVDVSPDWRVLTFSFLLTLVSGIAFGLAPALRATRPDLVTIVKDEGATSTTRSAGSWLRNGIVVVQVSLCLLLLLPAGLLLRSLQRVLATNPGYETKQLLSLGYSLELSGYDAQRAKLFQQQLMERLASLPGVQSVSLDRRFGGSATVTLLDDAGTTQRQFGPAPYEGISANYLETIGTPLVQGRGFTLDEVNAKAPVLIVSESTAQNVWPGRDVLGKRVRLERRSRSGSEVIFAVAQVIGVARDNQAYRVGQTAPLFFYRPEALSGELDTAILVRTKGDASTLKEAVRKEAYALEPVLRLFISTAAEQIAKNESVLSTRAASEAASLLGALALLLAVLGIYGVMAWSVANRTREIGIRMALGAQRRNVLALVLKQGMKLVLLGGVIGVPLSFSAMQMMKGFLFGLSTADPATFVAVTFLLTIVALLACYLPARRATKVDPIVSLRYE